MNQWKHTHSTSILPADGFCFDYNSLFLRLYTINNHTTVLGSGSIIWSDYVTAPSCVVKGKRKAPERTAHYQYYPSSETKWN
jgi:hypothetical protein